MRREYDEILPLFVTTTVTVFFFVGVICLL